jgi:LysM repeat protein
VDAWRRYAGPAAFLLAVTVAVLLIRSGLEHRGPKATAPPPAAPAAATTTAPTTTAARKPTRRYWTVRAGDTFAVIAAKTGLPVATIEQLNPTVKSTSLFIGEKLRIR